jgi:hypothetical protein
MDETLFMFDDLKKILDAEQATYKTSVRKQDAKHAVLGGVFGKKSDNQPRFIAMMAKLQSVPKTVEEKNEMRFILLELKKRTLKHIVSIDAKQRTMRSIMAQLNGMQTKLKTMVAKLDSKKRRIKSNLAKVEAKLAALDADIGDPMKAEAMHVDVGSYAV